MSSGKLSEVGHLSVGMPADVTILKLEDIHEELEDVEGQTRVMTKALTPVGVVKDGKQFPVISTRKWPNTEVKEQLAALIADWSEKDKGSHVRVK